MAYKCNICGSVFESNDCPHCGKVLLVGDTMLTQIFPENVKMGPQCLMFVTQKLIYLPDKAAIPQNGSMKRAVSNAVEQAARNGVSRNERIIPYQDILIMDYPAEDVKIGIFKRKGNRSIRIHRRSTGKYYDICFGKEKDAQSVYHLLLENNCI